VIKCENCNEQEVDHDGDWCDDCNLPEREFPFNTRGESNATP